MHPNADYLGIINLLRILRERGLVNEGEARKIAAGTKARLGADLMIFL